MQHSLARSRQVVLRRHRRRQRRRLRALAIVPLRDESRPERFAARPVDPADPVARPLALAVRRRLAGRCRHLLSESRDADARGQPDRERPRGAARTRRHAAAPRSDREPGNGASRLRHRVPSAAHAEAVQHADPSAARRDRRSGAFDETRTERDPREPSAVQLLQAEGE